MCLIYSEPFDDEYEYPIMIGNLCVGIVKVSRLQWRQIQRSCF
jgi:hypothetical protein